MENKILNYDIVIIGGGTAGLVAAVCSAKKLNSGKHKRRIALVEKENRVGKKLLATGNGRCNMTNENMSPDFYNESGRALVKPLISKYSTDKIIAFFNSLGLICKSDSQGRVYPYSAQATAVLDLLRTNIDKYSVDTMCETNITAITKTKNGFKISSPDKTVFADKVILATGGKASPKLGSDGATYKFAQMLNLKCTPVFPSLVPIKCSSEYLPFLKGIRTFSEVSLIADGKLIHKEQGELQLNQNNISGICIFQLSRFVNEFFTLKSIGGIKYKKLTVNVDFMPDFSLDELESILFRRRKQMGDVSLEEFFTGMFNKKIGQFLLKKLKIAPLKRDAYTLSDNELRAFAREIKSCDFIPSGLSDMDSAQVTAGGIDVSEVDKNLESVHLRGLYIVGEALDVDGFCGGYNLHWAFTSGTVAGNHAAEFYKKNKEVKT